MANLCWCRFDLRPFLYPRLSWAYKKIDEAVARFTVQQEKAKTA